MFRTRKTETEPLVSAPQRCLECPMCRAPLSAETIAGVCASCPLYHMKNGCGIDLIACPQCGYHSLPREHDGGAPRPQASTPSAASPGQPSRIAPEAAACAGATRLSDLRPGTRARLLGFNGIDDNHLGRLTAYGLLPGVAVEVLQRFPAIILAVYHSELALETELAHSVWVLPEG
jgi:hypothetical protein